MMVRKPWLLVTLALGLCVVPEAALAQTPLTQPAAPQPDAPQPAAPPEKPPQPVAPGPPPGQPATIELTTTPQPRSAEPAPATMPAREMLPAPGGIRPFATPQEVVGRELTLEEAVNIGLENAPKIVASIGDYLAAQQRVSQALAPLLPQLSGQWNYGSQQLVSRTTGLSAGTSGTATIFSRGDFTTATVTASQLLFDFGKSWAARDAARSNADVFRGNLETQKLDIVQLVKVQYFVLLLSKRLVEVNLAALDRAEINLRSAQGFFSVGTQPKSFVTRAEVDVANGRVNVIRAQNAVSLARVALNTAMGIAVNAPTEVKDILTYVPFQVDPRALVGEALAHRPEYFAAKSQADAAEATMRQTFRNFFPDLVGSGTYGGSNPDYNEIWSVGVALNWTIFDGGGKIARYKEAKASLEAAKARVRDTELQIWQNVEQTYLNMVSAEEQIVAAQKAVESAQENYELARGRFDAGVANIIELTDAQLALTQAQSTEAQALSDYRVAISNLERALGRKY